jgi:hypothetical protein
MGCIMSRISIEVTAEAHQRLKAFAALRGQTLKEYILERSLPELTGEELSEAEALRQLEQLLKPRIEAAQRSIATKALTRFWLKPVWSKPHRDLALSVDLASSRRLETDLALHR